MSALPYISILSLSFALLIAREIFTLKRKVRKLEKQLNIIVKNTDSK
jgi:hypothetical protein